MPNENQKDDILFEQLNRNKKRKRRRTVLTVLAIICVVLIALFIAVSTLRARVQERFNNAANNVKNYSATVGRISTTVSGSGVLAAVGSEQITVPNGVEIDEVLVDAGDTLKAGDPIASVKAPSVMTVLSETQDKLNDLDDQINKAKNDNVSAALTCGIGGRVKVLYADKGDNIVDVMTEHGAVALVSLDGLMCVSLDADLTPGEDLTLVTSDGKEYPAKAETISSVTVTDDGPAYNDSVTVRRGEDTIGTGTLAIHSPLAVTGYAGTVNYVNVRENQQIWAGGALYSLTNTSYTANYDTLLQSREDTQKTLNQLIAMLRTGVLAAPFDGTVSLVDIEQETDAATAYLAQQQAKSGSSDTAVVTMAPDESMNVSVAIDETDILSLAIGQHAEVTVNSVSDDPIPGTVTEITKSALSSYGVSQYSCVVTLDKLPKMLVGMSASVDVQIEGVDDVVLIPVDALHQTSSRSYVYTSYDEATQQYGDMVEVTAGVSNSNFVEIVSGLKEGDTVYYTEKNNWNFFMMPGMGGGGGMSGSRRTGMGG